MKRLSSLWIVLILAIVVTGCDSPSSSGTTVTTNGESGAESATEAGDEQSVTACEADADCGDGESCVEGACIAQVDEACEFETCGETCCADGESCFEGACCAASCEGKTCGSDGCGGSCGEETACDDGNDCTEDSCDEKGQCVNAPAEGTCDDGDACTTDDACAEGACVGTAAVCDDDNDCTDDSCDSETGCVNENNNEPCDDGDACTDGDLCSEGSCNSLDLVECSDDNYCTDDSCDPETGCVYEANALECDDDNPCTENDACADSVCVGGADKLCDDGNPCTTDSCDATVEGGCVFANNEEPCDDGNACTAEDTCLDGGCSNSVDVVCDDGEVCTDDSCDPDTGCITTPNTVGCDDGNACTELDTCADGTCSNTSPVTCDDENACTNDGCDPETGCTVTFNLEPCDDGDACTNNADSGTDNCFEGACVGAVLDCDDGNVCTTDSCDAAVGCQYENNTEVCTDDDACTTIDICADGACVPGEVANCDDENVCTDDSCDVASGCQNINNSEPCDDGDACTANDTCGEGTCSVNEGVACDDGNFCTDDSCDPAVGCVNANNTLTCEDDDACTFATKCTEGECVGITLTCDDQNPCTQDVCLAGELKSECFYNSLTGQDCDDDDACTLDDVCAFNALIGQATCQGDVKDCDDGIECSIDLCDTATGECSVNESNCPCTVEGDPKCDDGNTCTDDSCDTTTNNCVNAVNTANNCDDGNQCTQGDTCLTGGNCVGGPISCDDDNPCTDDSCLPAEGCVYTPNQDLCDDGDACSYDDQCAEAACVGVAYSCDDGNVCSDDICLGNGACENPPNELDCDDGNSCSYGDVCSNLACTGVVYDCDDGNFCTDDSCNGDNTCNNVNNTLACDDDVDCTSDDVCGGGSCAGTAYTCDDDGNVCTDEVCNGDGTCTSVNNTIECNDDVACTYGDTCESGVCSGSLYSCDDDNTCTKDECVGDGTCSNSALGSLPADEFFIEDVGNMAWSIPELTVRVGDTVTWNWAGFHNVQETDENFDALVGGELSGPPGFNGSFSLTFEETGTFYYYCAAHKMMTGVITIIPTNGVCDDGDLCTLDDACSVDGVCETVALTCDDGKDCSIDYCEAGECKADVSGCGCANEAADFCDDGNECTTDSCDDNSGLCLYENVAGGTVCDDGDACTTNTTCGSEDDGSAGSCLGVPVNCEDGNGCTIDTCDSAGGCSSVVDVGASCDDLSDPCIKNETCQEDGACVGTPFACSDGNQCTADNCVGNSCQYPALADGSACDDGNACTGAEGDTCLTGNCDAVAVVCDDDNTCTYDYCNAGLGCQYDSTPFIGAGCPSDGNPCTSTDKCDPNGICVGVAYDCDDGNICTDDSCNGDGTCTYAANTLPCNDNEDCTQNDVCGGGACAGEFFNCDDGDDCTADICDGAGNCANNIQVLEPCDDGDACTINGQCSATGTCVSDDVECDDGVACTVDACVKGACVVTDQTACGCEYDVDCDDSNDCTEDTCEADLTCQSSSLAGNKCDDGDPCTKDNTCVIADGSDFCGGVTVECDDGDQCTVDSCNPVSGDCEYVFDTGASCDDGDSCTSDDVCANATCKGSQLNCDDGNVCTTDSCDSAVGCTYTNNTLSCDDDNACTDASQCSGGSCQSTSTIDCASDYDDDPCLVGKCDVVTGCYADSTDNQGDTCDDDDPCTEDDACNAGSCEGTERECHDGQFCQSSTGLCINTMVDVEMDVSYVFIGDDDASYSNYGAGPEWKVSLSDYRIDVQEVSALQFEEFLKTQQATSNSKATCNGRPCGNFSAFFGNINENDFGAFISYVVASYDEDEPALGVTWDGADEYCDYIGRRMCTGAEWEYAARGDSGNKYSWGNFTVDNCEGKYILYIPGGGALGSFETYYVMQPWHTSTQSCSEWPADVSDNLVNTQGVRNMSGNALELVSDYWDGAYYCHGPDGDPYSCATGYTISSSCGYCDGSDNPWTNSIKTDPQGPDSGVTYDTSSSSYCAPWYGGNLREFRGGLFSTSSANYEATNRNQVFQNEVRCDDVEDTPASAGASEAENQRMGFRCCAEPTFGLIDGGIIGPIGGLP